MGWKSYMNSGANWSATCFAMFLAACGPSSHAPKPATAVGDARQAASTQGGPVGALGVYLDGFHFYNGNMPAQMEAHYFCGKVNEDLMQCVIYDGETANAHLMGVEYVVSAKLFKLLPAEEKKLWHSHGYEVTSGQLRAPRLQPSAEHALMKEFASTYGKAWHTWHTDQGFALPLGTPALVMAMTANGQLNNELLASRDKRLGIPSMRFREERTDIEPPPVEQGADSWRSGEILQLRLHHFDTRDENFTTASSGPLHSVP